MFFNIGNESCSEFSSVFERLEDRCLLSAAAPAPLLASSSVKSAIHASANHNSNGNSGASAAQAKRDAAFIAEDASGQYLEIDLGNLAQMNSSNTQAQAFGQRMITDHTANLAQLQTVATDTGVAISSQLSKSDQNTLKRLNKLGGVKFDKAYAQLAVQDHKKDIKIYTQEEKKTDNTELASYAAATLPVLQTHLSLAESLQQSVKGEKNTAR
jgi:putative membrane protein